MRREDKVRHKYSSRRPKAHAPIYERRNQFDSNALEKAFTEEWAKKCRPDFNAPNGILDSIVNPPDGGKKWRRCRRMNGIRLTTTDCQIVASVIQWLGTNCGFAFLQTCLAKDGWDIRAREDRKRFDMGSYFVTTKISPLLTSIEIVGVLKSHFDQKQAYSMLEWGGFKVTKVVDYHNIFRCETFIINGDDSRKMTIYQCAMEIRERVRKGE